MLSAGALPLALHLGFAATLESAIAMTRMDMKCSSCRMNMKWYAPRGKHVLNAQSLKRDGRHDLRRKRTSPMSSTYPTTLTPGHKAPVSSRPWATRTPTIPQRRYSFFGPSSGRGPVEALTIEAPARVFHQGPGKMPNMTGCSFAVRHLLVQHRQAKHEQAGKQNMKH